MNGFLRKLASIAASCLLFAAWALSAAVAAADSGSGGTVGDEHSASDNSGPGSSDERGMSGKDPSNDDAKVKGEDRSGDRGNSETHRRDGTGVLPNPGKAKQGERFNLHPGKGKEKEKVTVKLPGASKPLSLDKGASVPVGSVVDATHG